MNIEYNTTETFGDIVKRIRRFEKANGHIRKVKQGRSDEETAHRITTSLKCYFGQDEIDFDTKDPIMGLMTNMYLTEALKNSNLTKYESSIAETVDQALRTIVPARGIEKVRVAYVLAPHERHIDLGIEFVDRATKYSVGFDLNHR